MLIKEVKAKIIKDSRRKPTIQVIVVTDKGKFITSAPSGKSTGKYEVKLGGKKMLIKRNLLFFYW